MISLAIIIAIIAMIFWGTTDYLAAIATRKIGVFKTFFWQQIVNTFFLVLFGFIFFDIPLLSPAIVLLVILASLLNISTYAAYYKGLEQGTISLVSPLANTWPIVTIFIVITFFGESITLLQLLGAIIAIVGALLVSIQLKALLKLHFKVSGKGILWALYALFSWAIFFTFWDYMVGQFGWFLPILFFKTGSVVLLLLYSGTRKISVIPPKHTLSLLVLIGCLDLFGHIAYSFAINTEFSAVIAPFNALVPLVTVILATFFLKEKVFLHQKIGIAAILGGLILIAL